MSARLTSKPDTYRTRALRPCRLPRSTTRWRPRKVRQKTAIVHLINVQGELTLAPLVMTFSLGPTEGVPCSSIVRRCGLHRRAQTGSRMGPLRGRLALGQPGRGPGDQCSGRAALRYRGGLHHLVPRSSADGLGGTAADPWGGRRPGAVSSPSTRPNQIATATVRLMASSTPGSRRRARPR